MTLGRVLEAADEQDIYHEGSPPVVVSFVFWTSRLNRDPAVIGRAIGIGRTDATIIGGTERAAKCERSEASLSARPACQP